MSVGFSPADSLFCHAGGKLDLLRWARQHVPVDVCRRIFAAGRVNGVFDLETAQRRNARRTGGGRAAWLAAGPIAPTRHRDVAHTHPWPIFPHPKGKDFVDLDEDIQVKDLANAVQDGYDDLELLKRYTTSAWAPPGKALDANALRIRQAANQRPRRRSGHHDDAAAALPARELRGPGRARLRAGAADADAPPPPRAAGAEMMPAGLWYRPRLTTARRGSGSARSATRSDAVRTMSG